MTAIIYVPKDPANYECRYERSASVCLVFVVMFGE